MGGRPLGNQRGAAAWLGRKTGMIPSSEHPRVSTQYHHAIGPIGPAANHIRSHKGRNAGLSLVGITALAGAGAYGYSHRAQIKQRLSGLHQNFHSSRIHHTM